MGELKEIRDQQDNLIQRAKALGNILYLAGLGATAKPVTAPKSCTTSTYKPARKPMATTPKANPRPCWQAAAW